MSRTQHSAASSCSSYFQKSYKSTHTIPAAHKVLNCSCFKFHPSLAEHVLILHLVPGIKTLKEMVTVIAYYVGRYSDWLRAGRSGDRIPVEVRFSAPVQTGAEDRPALMEWVPVSFRGVKWPGRGGDHIYHRG